MPIEADLGTLAQSLDTALPRTLWTIDKQLDRCIPPQKVKLFGARLHVTPVISCTVSGDAVRGRLTLRGHGRELIATIPVHATVTARTAGKAIEKTATGDALVEARIALDVASNWTPTGTVRLHYDWTDPPGIDLLGRRITFTDKADEKLRPVVKQLEQTLPHELAKLDLRSKAAKAWRSAFTSVRLNDQDPQVWMRITPKRVALGSYVVADDRLRLNIGVAATTETFVGPKPSDPKPTELPSLSRQLPASGMRFFVPVSADYAELEPVVLRALKRRSDRAFVLPAFGPVKARFERVIAYGTTGGRIAVGIDLAAAPMTDVTNVTRGRIWLVARPINLPGSAHITFADLSISGATNGRAGDTLIALGNSPGIAALVGSALDQNLDRDLTNLVSKIRRAAAVRREGDFLVRARIDRVQTGIVQAAGDGVHLPVRVIGDAEIEYQHE